MCSERKQLEQRAQEVDEQIDLLEEQTKSSEANFLEQDTKSDEVFMSFFLLDWQSRLQPSSSLSFLSSNQDLLKLSKSCVQPNMHFMPRVIPGWQRVVAFFVVVPTEFVAGS